VRTQSWFGQFGERDIFVSSVVARGMITVMVHHSGFLERLKKKTLKFSQGDSFVDRGSNTGRPEYQGGKYQRDRNNRLCPVS
jgi:hypothetical protein